MNVTSHTTRSTLYSEQPVINIRWTNSGLDDNDNGWIILKRFDVHCSN